MPRAERRTPRAGARGQPPARASDAPRRDTSVPAAARRESRRRVAGEAARRGFSVTFFRVRVFVHTTRSFSHATDTSAPSWRGTTRGARGAFRARRATHRDRRHLRRANPDGVSGFKRHGLGSFFRHKTFRFSRSFVFLRQGVQFSSFGDIVLRLHTGLSKDGELHEGSHFATRAYLTLERTSYHQGF